MNFLFHLHSGLRFLILLMGVANLVVLGLGLAQKKEFKPMHKGLGMGFTGLLHTQVLIGLGMVAMGRYYPALIGHLSMMLLAAVVSQGAMSMNRRRTPPGFTLPLAGVGIALLLIVGGIMAIGRGVFTMTPPS
ncbi:MAG: hypothetical protein U0228_30520 [Myxococcaceae bacterium]